MKNETQITTNSSDKPKFISFTRRQLLAIGIILTAVIGGLLIWKAIQVNTIRKNSAENEMNLKSHFNDLLQQQSAGFLLKLAKPYVWALRTEMMQNNIRQVNLYNNDIVKEKHFISVMVFDAKGTVISSTDKKYEGKTVHNFSSPISITGDSAVVNKANDSLLVMTSPIMSFNSKLGTLIINYSIKNFDSIGIDFSPKDR